ncbi:hypothetical protein [Mycolicibacterium palauense]|uniref:hypothetical protein n=1 Tax=Mycolicibacterium palauense TaxID=2034511 RepID=UPI001145E067|nr:hypothetical protein [Mycolicibacterium palauense]
MTGRESRSDSVEAATQLAKATPSLGQVLPIGSHPRVDVLLVGAALWASQRDPGLLHLALVKDEDIENPALARVLATTRALAYARQPHGPQLVLDELRRSASLTPAVAEQLQTSTTSGADPLAIREYAAAVVADALRRRTSAAGAALSAIADQAAEADIAPMVERAAASVRDCADRLAALRGEA